MHLLTHLSLPEVLFLGLVVLAFGSFGVTLLGVSLYVELGHKPHREPVRRAVTQARRPATLANLQ